MAFGDFFVMVPYGLSLGVVTMVGGLLGKNDARGAKLNCLVTSLFSVWSAIVTCSFIVLLRGHLAYFYTDNEAVAELAKVGFAAFGVALCFDWI